MRGHAWTLWPFVRDAALPPRPPPSRPWSTRVIDPELGSLPVTGHLRDEPGADAIAVIIHGLSGCADSSYCLRAAESAARAGVSSLRLNLRGADLSGDDFYHAGLVADLEAALASPEVSRYRRVHLVGFSLGGHVALRLAVARPDAMTAVAAICSPLDLAAASRHIDGAAGLLYRPYLLRGLRAVYTAVAARRPMPTPLAELRRIRRLRQWDELTVVRRFGFRDADDYYQRMSVGPSLANLSVPALYLGADRDPMVAARDVRPLLTRASSALEVRWLTRAGHVGFPRNADIGPPLFDWLASRS